MNALLHGHNSLESVVAVQQLDDQTIRRYERIDGKISSSDVEFFPFFFIAEPILLNAFKRKFWMKELDGPLYYKYLAAFKRWSDFWDAIRTAIGSARHLSDVPIHSYIDIESIYVVPDPLTQYLLQSGVTLFKGMEFEQLARLQIEISTVSSSHKPSNPLRRDDRIIAIALTDGSGWECILDGKRSVEADMLQELVKVIQERDPDIIEGTHLSSFSLPYLSKRFSLHEIDFAIGRDGSPLKTTSPFLSNFLAERESHVYEAAGRHLVDTIQLAHTYDTIKEESDVLSIAELTQFLGIEFSDLKDLSPTYTLTRWQESADLIKADTLKRVRMTEKLGRILLPGQISITKLFPFTLGAMLGSSSITKIESLLLREYLFRKHSIPKPPKDSYQDDEASQIFRTGVFSDVVRAEIGHAHPIMLRSLHVCPQNDVLALFQEILESFLQLEDRLKSDLHQEERFDSKRDAIHTVLNGFFPYLVSYRRLFSSPDQGEELTKIMRGIYQAVCKSLDLHNSKVIQQDQTTFYFSVPNNILEESQLANLIKRISSLLPFGLELVPKQRYKKFLSFRRRNFAYLGPDSTLRVHGTSLIPHGIEPFLQRFLHLFLAHLLDENIQGLHNLYTSLRRSIKEHQWTVLDFAKTETLHTSLEEYERSLNQGDRKHSAAYEAVRRAAMYVTQGDQVFYYVAGKGANIKVFEHSKLTEDWDPNFPDENSDFYLSRLDEYTRRFDAFFSKKDFDLLFSADTLFTINAADVKILSKEHLQESTKASILPEKEDFRIWIDESLLPTDNS